MRNIIFGLLIACFSIACSSGPPPRPDCDELADACHSEDTMGPRLECHENAHDVWTNAECIANRASCLVVCEEPADGGAVDAASGSDAGVDSGS